MSKKYSVQYDSDRLNPQFVGISKRYSKKKRERKELEDRQHSLEKSVNYVNKMKDTIDMTLQRKKDQLAYLKSVRERHLTDIKQVNIWNMDLETRPGRKEQSDFIGIKNAFFKCPYEPSDQFKQFDNG